MRLSLLVALFASCGGSVRVADGDAATDADGNVDHPCAPAVVDVNGTCARKSDGTLWCWGKNASGSVGDGTKEWRSAPVLVPLSNIAKVAATSLSNSDHTCAAKSDGSLWCWGGNGGALGDGTLEERLSPLQVLSNVADIAVASIRSCAVKRDGSVWCWGDNVHGALGDGSTDTRLSPVPVTMLTSVTQVALGGNHACALRMDGTVWCWGHNTTGGEVGDPKLPPDDPIPVQVTTLGTDSVEIAVGGGGGCARKKNGRLFCWGAGRNLGDGVDHPTFAFVEVTALGSTVAQISAGLAHTCARKVDGTVWCWGDNDAGTVGDGTTANRLAPTQVTALGSSVAHVSAGGYHTCAAKTDGALWCWGNNSSSAVGDGTMAGEPCSQKRSCRLSPVKVSTLCP